MQLRDIQPLVDPLVIDGVDHVYCRGSYDQPILKRLVTGIKYNFYTGYRELLPEVQRSWLIPTNPDMALIPVPLHSRRERWRGFNQSRLIAAALTGNSGGNVAELLERSHYTTAQAKLNESQREHNLCGAFQLRSGVENVPDCGIIVDDVITTGSTIRECALVLRQAGMKHIIAVALAKG
jgi:ComF family protein